jgi:hypothetical protein
VTGQVTLTGEVLVPGEGISDVVATPPEVM